MLQIEVPHSVSFTAVPTSSLILACQMLLQPWKHMK